MTVVLSVVINSLIFLDLLQNFKISSNVSIGGLDTKQLASKMLTAYENVACLYRC